MKKKKKLIALFAGLSLAFVSSAALAAPSADTLLVAGYDSDQMAVLYGVSSIDQADDDTITLDCTLKGDFTYTVGEVNEDGLADVETLEGEDTDTENDTLFEAETVLTEGDAPDSILYDDLFGATEDDGKDCLLTSVLIEPKGEGEVNHGTVVSTFAHLLGGGKGCIMRLFSQSDFGKGEYEVSDPALFDVTLDSIATSCKNQRDRVLGVDDDSTSGETTKARGPQKEQKDKSNKGKSTAPGQNK